MRIALFASEKVLMLKILFAILMAIKVDISIIYSNNKNSGALLHAKTPNSIYFIKKRIYLSNVLVNELNSKKLIW